ncbi:MAG: hypothetical protein E5W76_33565 [Mesorhizobium sp.]|nr:MAG: hypothetical protein E5W76_33565 [Mesorhizobium sp.]
MHPAQRAQASDDEPGYRPARPEQTPPAGYSHPLPAQAGGQGANPRDQLAPQAPDTDEQQGQIDEIRESLREFREAVRELTESRSNRRYF